MPDTSQTITKQAEPGHTPHPCTALFPAMSPEEDVDFLADIERNGLREAIIIDQHNRIVDGMHRYRACVTLGIRPKFDQRNLTDEEAWALSLSLNFHRRHLSEATRAAVSAEVRKSANLPVTQAESAKAFNISERTQRSAEAILDASADLHQAVKEDKLSVHAAEKIARLPAAQRIAAIVKVRQGDVEGARALAKATRTDASNKPKNGDRKGAKTIANDAASVEVKTAAVGKKARPTTTSAATQARSSPKKQEDRFNSHPVYSPLFQEIDELVPELANLPSHLSTHPLGPQEAQHLLAALRDLRERIDSAINAAEAR